MRARPEDDTVEAASVALLRDGAVLLIRRAHPPYRGLWTLPGGGCGPRPGAGG